jgi:polysaccharide deacetylase family protein (PEP-CTERM system associated)
MKCVFSVDVEDWFHILDLPSSPGIETWDALPSRVEHNFRSLLDLAAERQIRITCFFLGWVAQHFPHLVRLAVNAGHEVASHGYAHRLAYRMTPGELYQDAYDGKRAVEEAAGVAVAGYRASGFSVTSETPWFFDVLAEAGYRYDSSVFPAARQHGGMRGARYEPYLVQTAHGDIAEFPITITTLLHRPVCLFGGGYLRLAPWWLIRREAVRVMAERRPVVFYVHPREIDPDQPRLEMSRYRRFKTYVNLRTTEDKIRKVLSEFEFAPFSDLLGDAVPAPTTGDAVCA